MDELICTALSRGGDYADLFFEYTVYQELLLRDGQVSSGGFHVDYGVGIRALKGERTGYAYSESTEMRDMLAAAAAASYIAKASSDNARKTYGRFQASAKNDFYPVLDDWSNNDAGRFIPVLTERELYDITVVIIVVETSYPSHTSPFFFITVKVLMHYIA